MNRMATFTYGIVCYALGMVSLVYLAGFLGNFAVPTSIDSSAEGPFWLALVVDAALIAVFGLQHSVMARPTFKRWWTRVVPQPVERSTYVLFSAAALGLLFWQWRPLGGVVWHVEDAAGRAALYALYGVGWIIVLATTFLINHFDLFGLQQVWLHLRGRASGALRFVTPGPYRMVRHPLYVGWLTVMWATPTMTAAHLLLAGGMTAYILIAIPFEERNLMDAHPEYSDYRRRVPMLLPRLKHRESQPSPATSRHEVHAAS
jgi:protein-S-isoprenylcysteine O-methyltransferase Ste14